METITELLKELDESLTMSMASKQDRDLLKQAREMLSVTVLGNLENKIFDLETENAELKESLARQVK